MHIHIEGMGPPPTLYMFVIHSQHLTHRSMRLHGTIQQLRTSAMAKGYEVRPILILNNDATEINAKINDLQSLVSYDPVGDPDFDNQRQMLSVEVISNIEKHKDAWKRIYDNESSHPDDLFMVMEDDAFILPDGLKHFEELIEKALKWSWDILFVGISDPQNKPEDAITALPLFKTVQRILPSKESYFIKQQTAKRMLDMLDKYRYPLRIQMSYILQKNPEIRTVHPNKRILLDGSKIGIFPSSLHPTNILSYNREYMEMIQYLSKSRSDVEKDLPVIRGIYKTVQHLNNPDIMHLYGVLLFKAGKVMDAEEILVDAVQNMHQQQGILNSRSDLMTNLINVYQHMQRDLPQLLASKSTYDDPSAALPDTFIVEGGV